jgi:ATPase subunit of ABC transporter with duplicated ATPase domains
MTNTNTHTNRTARADGGATPVAHTAGPAIEVAGLSKRFGATIAVDDLSFAVSYGRIVGFLGPNGAGKTTTLRRLRQYTRHRPWPSHSCSFSSAIRTSAQPGPTLILWPADGGGRIGAPVAR